MYLRSLRNYQMECSQEFIIITIQYINNMHKFVKKLKDGKKQAKKQNTNEKVEKKKKTEDDEEDDEPAGINVQISVQTQEQQKESKVPKVPTKVIDEAQIDYEMKNPHAGQKQKRISWVPQQGGVVKKFDYESQKEHFVAIGEQYKPPVEQKNSNFVPLANTNLNSRPVQTSSGEGAPRFTNSVVAGGSIAPMQKTPQQLLEEQMEAKLSGLKAPSLTKEELEAKKRRQEESKNAIGPVADGPRKIPTFTKGSQAEVNVAPIQKSKQQLMEEEMLAKGQQFQSPIVSKQEKAARQAQRKRKEEEAAKLINFGSGEKKILTFTAGKDPNFKPLQKTAQQLMEEKIQQQMKSRNLKPKILTKQQQQQKRLKQLQRQEQQKLQQKEQQQPKPVQPVSTEAPKIPRFTNSGKTSSGQPQFVDLK